MKLSDCIDIITRVKSCFEEREQGFLFALLDSYEDYYQERRSTRLEQVFWNQFWYAWDFPKLRDARRQAFDDMAADKYFHHIKENRAVYRNFEKAVAFDLLCCRLQILIEICIDFADLTQEIFYNLQNQVQQFLESNDLPPIITKRLELLSPKPIIGTKEIRGAQSVKKAVSTAVTVSKKESQRQKRKQHRQERKEQRLKNAKDKNRKWSGYCRLQIATPDGELIESGNSNLTFLEFIKRVGWHRVAPLHISYEDEPLFGTEEKNRWYKRIDSLAVLNCRMPCEEKIKIIKQICAYLGLSFVPSMTEPL